MRALKQHELGGLAVPLLMIWTIIGVLKRVCFMATEATAALTTELTTKTHLNKLPIFNINHGTCATIPRKRSRQIYIQVEKNVPYPSIPLRETPATMPPTLVAKWPAQREDMHLCATERPRRLLSDGPMLFQPWDVWLGPNCHNKQGYETEWARNTNQVTVKWHARDGAPSCQCLPVKIEEKAILFDLTTAELRHAKAVVDSVTQGIDLVYFDGEANKGHIAGGSTWEHLRLLLPWDVWIPHSTTQLNRESYFAQTDGTQ